MPSTSKLSASERRKLAEDFIASAQWKFLDSRGTSARSGEPTRVTLRVFTKGCPRHALREVHEALARQATVTDPVVDQTVVPGVWHHKTSLWSKDERTGESGQATYTILRIFGDGTDTETDVVEDGCGSRTTLRFVWDAASVEDVTAITHSGEQGYSVRIGGVSRDPETNLFSYYVTTTERKTQLVPEYVSADGAFFTDYDAVWLGLRGTTVAPTDDAGDVVAVPGPETAVAGDTVGVSWERSLEDCTLSARGRRKRAKRNVTSSETSSKDLYSIETTTAVAAAENALGAAPEPAAGVIKTHRSELREDRLHNTNLGVKTEREVLSARTATEEDAFRKRVTVAHKSTATAAPAASAAGGVIVVPSEEKTPGALKDVTIVTITEKVGSRGAASSQDSFSSESSVEDVAAAPLGDAPSAAGGVITQHSDKPTPGGLFERRKTVRTEKAGSRGTAKTKTAFDTEESVEDVAASPLGEPPEAAGGVIVSHSDSPTPGGLVQRRKRTKTEKTGSRGNAASATIFESETRAESVAAAPVAGASAGGGVITGVTNSPTPGGLQQVAVSLKTELPVPRSSVTERKTPWYTQRTERDTHASAPHVLGGAEYATAEYDRSPGGLYNRSKSTITDIQYGSVLRHSKTEDAFGTTEITETVESIKNFTGQGLTGQGTAGATITDIAFARNDDGYYVKTKTVSKPGSKIWTFADASYLKLSTNPSAKSINVYVEHYQFTNATEQEAVNLLAKSVAAGTTATQRVAYNMEVNKFGLYSGVYRRIVETER